MAYDGQIACYQALIALAWADGTLDPREKALLEKLIHEAAVLDAQEKENLIIQVDTPISIDDVWPKMNNKRDRAHLLNLSMAIFFADEHYSNDEREVYERLHKEHFERLGTKEDWRDIISDAIDIRKDLAS